MLIPQFSKQRYGSYHRQCFKCMKCKRPLDYQMLAEGPDNDVSKHTNFPLTNCDPRYIARTVTRTRTVTSRRRTCTTLIAASFRVRREKQMSVLVALERCAVLQMTMRMHNTSFHKVFEAEKQIAKPGSYHRKCFTCAECKHQMDPTNFANGPDNEVPKFIFSFIVWPDLLRPLLRADPW